MEAMFPGADGLLSKLRASSFKGQASSARCKKFLGPSVVSIPAARRMGTANWRAVSLITEVKL
jgi:hypothetical protein